MNHLRTARAGQPLPEDSSSTGKEPDLPALPKLAADPGRPTLQLGIHPDYVCQTRTQLLFDTVGHFKVGFDVRHLDGSPFLTCDCHLLTDTRDVKAPDGRKVGSVSRSIGLVPGFAIKAAVGPAKATVKWYPPPWTGVSIRFKNILGDNEAVNLELYRHDSSGKAHSIRVGGADGQIVARYERAEDGIGRTFTRQRKDTLITVEPGIDAALIVGIIVVFHMGRQNMV